MESLRRAPRYTALYWPISAVITALITAPGAAAVGDQNVTSAPSCTVPARRPTCASVMRAPKSTKKSPINRGAITRRSAPPRAPNVMVEVGAPPEPATQNPQKNNHEIGHKMGSENENRAKALLLPATTTSILHPSSLTSQSFCYPSPEPKSTYPSIYWPYFLLETPF
ncbi:hypothetical protein C8F04DRAFT_1190481 [Mycena alexandri]|uniref:Uncharacterized protein n=1 Tax=Mycena alexandri TaxID=1745969 RepID=A0AAD6SGB4_9AGAR|nr:hypothetical protein C8F04DRAFT_1190481 [Mycena alexandri]